MSTTNPYAPPKAEVQDIVSPTASATAAERGARLGAAILDTFAFGLMVYLPLIFSPLLIGVGTIDPASGPLDRQLLPLLVLPVVGVAVWLWLTIKFMRANGQSIGKKAVGIKVVRSDGSRASLARLIGLRNVLNGVISIVPLYGIIDILFIFSESRQCVHDRLADTIVIKA